MRRARRKHPRVVRSVSAFQTFHAVSVSSCEEAAAEGGTTFEMRTPWSGRIVVVGNEKGGSGKSTTAMHLIISLMELGYSVASIDADVRQRSLTQYLDNRRRHAFTSGRALSMPEHGVFEAEINPLEYSFHEQIAVKVRRVADVHDIVVIDTPGHHTLLSQILHSLADVLITPINDSFVDLDVIAKMECPDGESLEGLRFRKQSHYAEMVSEAKERRAGDDGGSIDWIVLRNRLGSLDARNKRRMEEVLSELADLLDFRLLRGLSERVIFRELFPNGLTLMDMGLSSGGGPLTLSHVAARQEIRALVDALGLTAR
jgi:chromosome partitioning protein